MVKRKISQLIDHGILEKIISDENKRRKFLDNINLYDDQIESNASDNSESEYPVESSDSDSDESDNSIKNDSSGESDGSGESDSSGESDNSDEIDDSGESYESFEDVDIEIDGTECENKRKLSPYNEYMQLELPRIKEIYPELSQIDRFKIVAELWKSSPQNPKNI